MIPVALRLTARQRDYKLDLGGRPAHEFRALIKRLKENPRDLASQPIPESPAVDLQIDIVPLTSDPVRVLLGGTCNGMFIEVNGPGVLTFTPSEPVPAMMCPPEAIPISRGSSYTVYATHLPFPVLPAFAWGRSFTYWTEPGEYTLRAVWNAGISPAPPGSRDDGNGFGHLTISSDPVTVYVQ